MTQLVTILLDNLFCFILPSFRQLMDNQHPQKPAKKPSQKRRLVLALLFCCVVLPQMLPNRAFASDSTFLQKTGKSILSPLKKAFGFQSNAAADTPSDVVVSDELPVPAPNDIPPTAQITTPPNTPDLLAVLHAEFALHRNDPMTALQLYKQEAHKQNATAVFERALGLSMQLEDASESLSFAKAWQDENQDHIPVWFFVTHLALKSGDYETAAANINMILEYDPNMDLRQAFEGILPTDPVAQNELAHALEAVGNDNNPSLSALRATLLSQLGEHKTALLWANQAVSAQPKNLAFLTLKADMLKEAGNHKKLLAFLSQAAQNTTGETQKQLYLYQIRHLIDAGDLKSAFYTLNIAHKKFGDDHEITLLAGLVALDIKAHKEAVLFLNKLIDKQGYAGQARYYLGIAYERQNKMPEAIANLDAVDDPEWLMSAKKKILTHYLNQGEIERAIDLLVALRQQHPMFASESYELHANILVSVGKSAQAKALLATAVQENPDDTELLYASTRLLDDNDEFAQKLTNIGKLRQADPYNLRYKFEQARLNLLKNPNDSTAFDELQQVSQLAKASLDSDTTLYTETLLALANNDLVRGKFLGVIARLNELYKENPNLPMGELLLRAYYALGDQDEVARLLDELTQRFGNKSQAANTNSAPPSIN